MPGNGNKKKQHQQQQQVPKAPPLPMPKVVTKILAGGADPNVEAEQVNEEGEEEERGDCKDKWTRKPFREKISAFLIPCDHGIVGTCKHIFTSPPSFPPSLPPPAPAPHQAPVKGDWQKIPFNGGASSSSTSAFSSSSSSSLPSSATGSFFSRLFVTLYGEMAPRDLVRVSWFAGTLFFIIGGYWLLRSLKVGRERREGGLRTSG
jgi:hypothetical protein